MLAWRVLVAGACIRRNRDRRRRVACVFNEWVSQYAESVVLIAFVADAQLQAERLICNPQTHHRSYVCVTMLVCAWGGFT
jgi:hypothetical protein